MQRKKSGDWVDFGLVDYERLHRLQRDLVLRRLHDEMPDTLLLGEHPPVITLGRGTHRENLLAPTFPVIETERGGDVTYHGPGQLVGYPIFKLTGEARDLHQYLRRLEAVLIGTLQELGIEGCHIPGKTGVWIKHPLVLGPRKIASIGVAVKSWVTYHGFALNIHPEMLHFKQVNPCGFSSDTMVALTDLSGNENTRPVTMPEIKLLIVQAVEKIFGVSLQGQPFSAYRLHEEY